MGQAAVDLLAEGSFARVAVAAPQVDHRLAAVVQRGYEATTVAEIAAAAEVSPRTFFTYFPAKEEVLFAETDDRVKRLRTALASRAPGETALGHPNGPGSC